VYVLFSDAFIPFPRSVIVIDAVLSFVLLGGLRFVKRLLLEARTEQSIKPTLIIGSGTRSATVIQNALKGEIDYYPKAILSLEEHTASHNAYIGNIKIYAPTMLEELAEKEHFQAAIIAETLSQEKLRAVVERLNAVGVFEIKQAKLLGNEYEQLEDLSIGDLLARRPKDLDTRMIEQFIVDKKILITGAGGSIGAEIARQCQAFGAALLILVDNGEFNLYRIGETLPTAQLKLVNVTDKKALAAVFAQTKPDVVIHAAAYKHVPICEANPRAAVENNILGSINVVDTAIEHKVGRVVIISTDKAVRPTNVMGATKRVVELYAQNVESQNTEIVSVRFGNVLGSSGSVIPNFKEQIEQNGPVTVTHPEMTRYFMLIPEACQLVLQAAAIAKGGELFILDMGEPVKVLDLAKQMIRLYDKEDEIEIVFSGLRPGEKLYEELLISPDDALTPYPSITVARPTPFDVGQLMTHIKTLAASADPKQALRTIVPEYQPQGSDT
jgi:UDP-N-acetyl-D-glucosamine 4,6-dehydratase